jgi:hypothetical protein
MINIIPRGPKPLTATNIQIEDISRHPQMFPKYKSHLHNLGARRKTRSPLPIEIQ